MSLDIEKIRKIYKERAPQREALDRLHNQQPTSLAKKLGYDDIDYSDSQLDSDEVIKAMPERHSKLKKEWEGLQKK